MTTMVAMTGKVERIAIAHCVAGEKCFGSWKISGKKLRAAQAPNRPPTRCMERRWKAVRFRLQSDMIGFLSFVTSKHYIQEEEMSRVLVFFFNYLLFMTAGYFLLPLHSR